MNELVPARWTYSIKDAVILSMKDDEEKTASVRDKLRAYGVPLKRFKVGKEPNISYLIQVIDPRLHHLRLMNIAAFAATFGNKCYEITGLIAGYED